MGKILPGRRVCRWPRERKQGRGRCGGVCACAETVLMASTEAKGTQHVFKVICVGDSGAAKRSGRLVHRVHWAPARAGIERLWSECTSVVQA